MRSKFFEMLSSLSSHNIDQAQFVVTPPTALGGVHTYVEVTPEAKSNIYGALRVQYKRFDLSTLSPITLVRQGELYTTDLAKRLGNYTLFKYGIKDRLNENVMIPRFLQLTPEDIQASTLPPALLQAVTLQLHAAPTSDFFVGSLAVVLLAS